MTRPMIHPRFFLVVPFFKNAGAQIEPRRLSFLTVRGDTPTGVKLATVWVTLQNVSDRRQGLNRCCEFTVGDKRRRMSAIADIAD